MKPTEVSETSTLIIYTPGNYPKEEITRYSKHGESLKTRKTTLSSSLCSFLHYPVTSSLLGPNIPLNTLFSNTLSLRFSLKRTITYDQNITDL
jgi:hypothetical protein